MADRRGTDVSKLTFPFQVVIVIVSMAVASVTTRYATQGGNEKVQNEIRSDIRDVLTRIQGAHDVAEVQSKINEERLAGLRASIDAQSISMKAAIDAVSRKQELQALQINELSQKFSSVRK